MPTLKNVGGKVQIEIERLDGGLNTKDSPSKISPFESPECKNVEFTDRGSVQTRSGTTFIGEAVNTSSVDGQASYNGSHLVWAGGMMYHKTAATWAAVTAASGQFASGANVASEVYQSILFCSDGTNGPYRYEGPTDFYEMGIDIPSAPTSLSDTAGDIAADTYYYKVAFVNSHVVTGEAGSASVGVTIGASATIKVENIPVATGLQGVESRKIYRATSSAGTYRLVKTLSDNVTTSFTDTVAVGDEGSAAVTDGTAPTVFSTIRQHKERLFFPDSEDKSLLRFTDYQNPFISQADNFFSVHKGTGETIKAIGVQDDFVCTFYDKKSIWIYDLTDPSDETSWTRVKSPANMGIVGPNALAETENGIVFVGKLNGKLSGIHILSGINVAETADDKLRTQNIAEKIEPTILAWPDTLLSKIAVTSYGSRLYLAVPDSSTSTILDGIMYFDILRLGDQGQPGSWAPWDGITVQNFLVHEGELYGGSSNGDGRIIQFNSGEYQDADGSAIDSYFWTKQFGGESAIESYQKDGRYVFLWYDLVGGWNMNYRYRKDGDAGQGTAIEIDLTPPSGVWGTAYTWNPINIWGGGATDAETQHSISPILGRRFQHRFDNQNTAGQYFRVHALKMLMNLRRIR